jgi:hypothetical protein
MPPYSFQFTSPSIDLFELRQQLADLHLGILHCIELHPPNVIVHYANFTKQDVQDEIELKGKRFGNMFLLPYIKIDLTRLHNDS